MNKILIALGLTLAASTGAFAASPNDYVELNAPTGLARKKWRANP